MSMHLQEVRKILESTDFELDRNYLRKILSRDGSLPDIYEPVSETDYHGMYILAYDWITKRRQAFSDKRDDFMESLVIKEPLKAPKNFNRPITLEDVFSLEKIIAKIGFVQFLINTPFEVKMENGIPSEFIPVGGEDIVKRFEELYPRDGPF